MSSRLRESDDKGAKKGGSYWKAGDKNQRSSEAVVGEVGGPSLSRRTELLTPLVSVQLVYVCASLSYPCSLKGISL